MPVHRTLVNPSKWRFISTYQVVYETKTGGDDLMMTGSEVVVANEEEVVEHEQLTIHYISTDGRPS